MKILLKDFLVVEFAQTKCDVCGSALYIRKDDNAETVKVRLEEYHRTSKDLLEYYRKDNRLKTVYPKIDSSVESLMNEIKKILEI